VYLAINALRPALRDFEEVLRLQPNSPDAYLGRAHVRVQLSDPQEALADADRAVKGQPKEPHLWHGAAGVYAHAAARLKVEPSAEQGQARLRARYQEWAAGLLRQALLLVPARERPAYWRQKVVNDAALSGLRGTPPFIGLAASLGGRDR
jgi:tetratricopeptide (TPR) repeat protein